MFNFPTWLCLSSVGVGTWEHLHVPPRVFLSQFTTPNVSSSFVGTTIIELLMVLLDFFVFVFHHTTHPPLSSSSILLSTCGSGTTELPNEVDASPFQKM